MKKFLLLFSYVLFLLQSSKSQTLTDEQKRKLQYCLPTPDGFYFTALGVINPTCKEDVLPEVLEGTKREFYCCKVSMKKKSGSGVDSINGCIAVMKSYIDDDRYEDIIDYFERGKQYKLRNYFVMLGNRSYYRYMGYLPYVNGTKYEVEKLDCFSENNWINIFLIFAILFLIY